MPVLGVAAVDTFGNDAKLIIEKQAKGRASFRILIFASERLEYDVTVYVDSEKVDKIIEFLMG